MLSLFFSILAIILTYFIWPVGLILADLGLFLGYSDAKKDTGRKAAGIVAIILSLISLIIIAILLFNTSFVTPKEIIFAFLGYILDLIT